MKETQKKIYDFMQDLKKLSEKHGIKIEKPYDEPIYLIDRDGNRISGYIDFENYEADSSDKYISKKE